MAKIIGQSTALKIMSGIYKSGRLHHAYLFSGPDGVGKFESALNFSKAMLCDKNDGTYCDECPSCKSIDAYKHPDVIVATTDKRHINAFIYYNQFIKNNSPRLFKEFYNSTRSILYKLESGLFGAYDNYPSSEPQEFMLGSKKESSRDQYIEPYYLAVNFTLNELSIDNASNIEDIFSIKSKEALALIKSRGGSRKKISIEGGFFDALQKLYYNIIHTVIPLDTVRDIIERTYRKPSQGRKRVIIIEGLDLMDGRSPNIFLHTLEEPTDNNIFILLTSNQDKIIKPLLSRVMDIKFDALTEKTLTSILVRRFMFSEEDAAFGVGYSEGSISNALKFILDKNSSSGYKLDDVLTSLLNAIRENNNSKLANIMTSLCDGTYDGVDVIKRLCIIFSECLRTRYIKKVEDDSCYDIIPFNMSDESLAWFIDDLDQSIRTLSTTNSQEKIVLRKVVTDIYMFFNKYLK